MSVITSNSTCSITSSNLPQPRRTTAAERVELSRKMALDIFESVETSPKTAPNVRPNESFSIDDVDEELMMAEAETYFKEQRGEKDDGFLPVIQATDKLHELPDFIHGWDTRGLKCWENDIIALGRKQTALVLQIDLSVLDYRMSRKRKPVVRMQNEEKMKLTEDEEALERAVLKLKKAEKARVRDFVNSLRLIESEFELGNGSKARRDRMIADFEAELKSTLSAAIEAVEYAEINSINDRATPSVCSTRSFDHDDKENDELKELSFERAAEVRRKLMAQRTNVAKQQGEEKSSQHKTISARLEKMDSDRRSVLSDRINQKMARAEARRNSELLKRAGGAAYYHAQVDTMLKAAHYY